MSVRKNPKKRVLSAANDNQPGEQRIVVDFPKNLPISIVEVELFDQLISSLECLTANDNAKSVEDDA